MFKMMIVLAAMLMVMVNFSVAQSTQPAEEESANPYAVDFTKTMGKYTLSRCEGQQVAGEGLKLTDLKADGGPMLETPKADVSETPVAVIELENKGGEELSLYFKVKSPEQSHTNDKVKVEPGKQTLKLNLKKTGIDLKELNYIKLFGTGKVDLVIKSISFAKAD